VREAKPKVDKESLKNVLFVAISVCLVCSIVVSTAAVVLKPMQRMNQINDERQNILRAAGMLPEGRNVDEQGRTVDELFELFEVRAVDLRTGLFTDEVDPYTFEPIRAARDPSTSTNLTAQQDIATLGRRENISVVYIRRTAEGEVDRIVLPIRGYGLWGTLFGYLALDGDLQTIAGLGFYSHRETPGLGGEVDNPIWKQQWPGVTLYDADRAPAVRLVKTRAPDGSEQGRYEVDALAGATLTTRGIEFMIRFWTGELGFGPFLENLNRSQA
jgi:Na+-transporting NADH:ubiquinone oxidoreductase subunit C